MLDQLANLRLDERPILGDRNINGDVANVAEKKRPEVLRRKTTNTEDEIIHISSDEENGLAKAPAAHRLPKAIHLNRLTKSLPDATNNAAMSKVVREFIDVLQSNQSRVLTKEGFAFLDGLYKQLADPEVFAIPMRTSRSRGHSQFEEDTQIDLRRAKMNKLSALRRDASCATNNSELAKLVTDFGRVIDKSNGRNLTKEAFGFLEALATRLRALR